MNKNDLRFQKTELLIKQTYISLKKHGSTQVKVKELCEAAMINKTTFYSHYETMEHLHKQVCTEFVAEILSQCDSIENIKTQTQDFIYTILELFLSNISMIEKLYGNDQYALTNDVENILMKDYISQNTSDNFDITIRFCVGGAFRLLVSEKDPIRIQQTVELIEKVLN